jgi:TPR repeat protein
MMKSFDECKKAAESGDAQAQFDLGDMYSLGENVPQDYVESLKWYERAAAQGHATAQYNVGIQYAKGLGVDQDYHKAVECLFEADRIGDEDAVSTLSMLYALGKGFDQTDKRVQFPKVGSAYAARPLSKSA